MPILPPSHPYPYLHAPPHLRLQRQIFLRSRLQLAQARHRRLLPKGLKTLPSAKARNHLPCLSLRRTQSILGLLPSTETCAFLLLQTPGMSYYVILGGRCKQLGYPLITDQTDPTFLEAWLGF